MLIGASRRTCDEMHLTVVIILSVAARNLRKAGTLRSLA